jgi:hypothetical protein
VTKTYGWTRAKPPRKQYGHRHRVQRERELAQLRNDGAGTCAETVCVHPSRVITPDMDLHLCHDTTGTKVIGLGHADCNRREAARRARALQDSSPLRW